MPGRRRSIGTIFFLLFLFFLFFTSRQRQINFSFLSSLFTQATLTLSFRRVEDRRERSKEGQVG
ncbi:hypothetical protein NC651_039703 [Populus alba x Populus x berolinensis]|nr:hypothetical protein NC651_039703 [Populus alba x Populus x berolinensis]